MSPALAISSTGSILAVIGLVVGLVVLFVVIWLLNDVLRPLRSIMADIVNAETAPMLKKGIPGADQLGQTRRLAESVPPLALSYLNKLALGPRPPAPAPSAPPPPAQAPAAPAAAPSQQHLDAPSSLPAWKTFSQ